MFRLIALVLSAAMALVTAPPLFAARGARGGTITGNAKGAQGENLASHTVRVRNMVTGQLAGSTLSGATGQFSFTGLNPGSYVIEIVNQAGLIVGTSSAVTLDEGATAAVVVGTIAPEAAAAGSGSFFTSTAGIVTLAAAGAGVAGIVAATNKSTASPSR